MQINRNYRVWSRKWIAIDRSNFSFFSIVSNNFVSVFSFFLDRQKQKTIVNANFFQFIYFI